MNPEIDKLIDLAIENGLSVKEREILINKAKSNGIDQHEFELYLENKLEKSQTKNTSCVKCGSLVPAVSKVCKYCGFIFTANDQKVSIDYLIQEINKNLLSLKSLPKFNVFKTLFVEYWHITVILLSFYFITLAIISQMSVFAIPMIILGPLLFFGLPIKFMMHQKRKADLANNPALAQFEVKPNFNAIKASFESNKKLASIYYGEDMDVKNLINNFTKEEANIDAARKKNIKFSIITFIVIIALPLFVFLIPFDKINAEKRERFNKEMSHIANFKKELTFKDSTFTGNFANYAVLLSRSVNVMYEETSDMYNNPQIFHSIIEVKFKVIKRDTTLFNPKLESVVYFTLTVVDESGKPLNGFPELTTDCYGFNDLLKDGFGEIVLKFTSSVSGGVDQKSKFENFNKSLKDQGKYFTINSSYVVREKPEKENN